MSSHTISPESWLSARRFHQSVQLSIPSIGRLRITYSDFGYGACAEPFPTTNLDSKPRAVVVFIGGLMGGRYTVLHVDEFCRQNGIRIITIDRPGMGGSQHVPPAQRMSTWLATFEGLLDHLNLDNVAIASHSGGAIFATNTLIHCQRYLHPERPSVAFFAPFCHSKDSGSMTATTALLRVLPGSAVAHFDKLPHVIGGMSASLAWSSGLVTPDAIPVVESSPSSAVLSTNGEIDMKWWADVSRYMFRCLLAEDISGSSEEALFYLRKHDPPVPWGESWKTYNEAARIVAENCKFMAGTLRISAFHAATDNMVGKGRLYFDQCWRPGNSQEGDAPYHYTSEVCPGTNHDSIISPEREFLRKWLKSLIET